MPEREARRPTLEGEGDAPQARSRAFPSTPTQEPAAFGLRCVGSLLPREGEGASETRACQCAAKISRPLAIAGRSTARSSFDTEKQPFERPSLPKRRR